MENSTVSIRTPAKKKYDPQKLITTSLPTELSLIIEGKLLPHAYGLAPSFRVNPNSLPTLSSSLRMFPDDVHLFCDAWQLRCNASRIWGAIEKAQIMVLCLLFGTTNVFFSLSCLFGGRGYCSGGHGGSLVAGVVVCGCVVYKAKGRYRNSYLHGGWGTDEVGVASWHRRGAGTFVFMQPNKPKQVTGLHSNHQHHRAPAENKIPVAGKRHRSRVSGEQLLTRWPSFYESECTNARIVGKSEHSHFDLLGRSLGALNWPGVVHRPRQIQPLLRLPIRGGGRVLKKLTSAQAWC